MSKPAVSPGARELFRYARVYPPRVLHLDSRIAALTKPRNLQAATSPDAARAWAAEFIDSADFVQRLADLKLAVLQYLDIAEVPRTRLPCRRCIKNPEELAKYLRLAAGDLAAAIEKTTLSLYATLQLGMRAEAAELARLLQFLELLPRLPTTDRRMPYAPAALYRCHRQRPAEAAPASPTATGDEPAPSNPSSAAILQAWNLANEYRQWKKPQLKAAMEAVKTQRFTLSPPEPDTKSRKKPAETVLRKARQQQYRAYSRAKKTALQELKGKYRALTEASARERVEALRADADFRSYIAKRYGADSAAAIDSVKVPDAFARGFCELFATQKDRETLPNPKLPRCDLEFDDPCLKRFASDLPKISGSDDVRPLGMAELVTVEENWLRYKPGEISAIENILKGELRKKKVKSTRYFEEVTEQLSEEATDQETASESRMKQDLGSQIESELRQRFDSDISASLNGSGGGSIGVVNLEGGASLAAGLGVGLDSSLSSSTESDFSQEIVSKALERTRRLTSEFRRSRSYSQFVTTNILKIDNSGDGATHTNGIYCFLDKEVCITERVYGIRKFLNADLLHPGTAVITKEIQQLVLNQNEAGRLPQFDIAPSDVTPANYLALVGRYRAANVSPPPSSIKIISKTWKTDLTNENREQDDISFKKVADVLAPFFGKYKRFLIQDEIAIPEGYRVQGVTVTVTHGSNGVSIPAHLPFSLIGAALYAMPTLAAAAVPPYTFFYLPVAIWQTLYTASPLLHYNADSSNVTINIGHQTEESPYFFFQPDTLITELVEALGNSSLLSEDFLDFIRQSLQTLYTSMTATSNNALINALTNVSDDTVGKINTFIASLQSWLANLVTNVIPAMLTGGTSSGPALPPIPSVDPAVIAAVPEAILAPFKTFFDGIVEHMEDLMGDVFGGIFEYFNTMLDNTDTHEFFETAGFIDTLPISFNCIALKPGITINLSACLIRIDDLALDAWRLETYDRLNQAYYQMQADFDSNRQLQRPLALRDNPALLRQEELAVIKERIIRLLHSKYSADPHGDLTLEELRLFEHAIDWENLSYRLFNYGPNGRDVAFRKLGLFASADERRKQFMTALWAQALIPLREDERLEQVFIKFLETGQIDFEADLLAALAEDGGEALDELTVIYRDMILQRQLLPEVEPRHRREILPTELMVIYEATAGAPYPVNAIDCSDATVVVDDS